MAHWDAGAMTYTNGKEDTAMIEPTGREILTPIDEGVRIAQRNHMIVKVVQTLAGLGMFWAMAWCSRGIWG